MPRHARRIARSLGNDLKTRQRSYCGRMEIRSDPNGTATLGSDWYTRANGNVEANVSYVHIHDIVRFIARANGPPPSAEEKSARAHSRKTISTFVSCRRGRKPSGNISRCPAAPRTRGVSSTYALQVSGCIDENPNGRGDVKKKTSRRDKQVVGTALDRRH